MATPNHTPAPDEAGIGNRLLQPIDRRLFLRYTGVTAAATGLLLAGCDDDDNNSDSNAVNVGTGDFGVLNYAFALEQLEAAFYTQLRTGSYYTGLGANSAEKQILDDLALHEKIHADFFRAAIPANGGTLIKDLEPDFSSINFNSKDSVLKAAQDFEDLGVAAYNGAGRYLSNPLFLSIAGKIVSVEARHAGLIRDLRAYNTFVANDVVDVFTPTPGSNGPTPFSQGTGTGLERSKTPSEVVAIANNFLKSGSKLNVSGIS
ncbi:ferritin-like domain-containing protein [Hymenobacter sp. CRA2]|uniref:ferritin-like domain-containing protein n=1 Tax=Hymenobacter sp. CRA2 TaxID=1955620 RepID=UPI00098FDCE0|nr:ferritin-like domain-containing protein [Hymenobacter sp. CRA2]OON67929.1 Tat (twin-arginine translocation) pathway signal sequence containing protein [Hymenobacter sp. CRA2]